MVAVERHELAQEAQNRLIENGYDNILVKEGNINEGAKKEGPYDAILIEGAVEYVNEEIINQLKHDAVECDRIQRKKFRSMQVRDKTKSGTGVIFLKQTVRY